MLCLCTVIFRLWPHGLHHTGLLYPWIFSRPDYWSGLPCPPPGDLPNSGIKPRSLALKAGSLPAEPPGAPRLLEWIAYPFFRGSSWPRNRTRVSCIAGGFFTSWATTEALSGIIDDLLIVLWRWWFYPCNYHLNASFWL